VLAAKRRDTRIVNPRPDDFAGDDRRAQMRPVRVGFREQEQSRGLQPCIDRLERQAERCRLVIDTRVGDDAEKFMHARPRNGPRSMSFCKFTQAARRDSVKWSFFAVRIDEDIGVDRDHSLGYP